MPNPADNANAPKLNLTFLLRCLTQAGVALATVVVALALVGGAQRIGWILPADGRPEGGGSQSAVAAEYTCPMHPQIRQDAPGKCPICGMDLVPMDLSEQSGDRSPESERRLSMSREAVALAEIETSPVRREIAVKSTHAIGYLAHDTTRRRVVSTDIGGRLDELRADYAGQHLEKGAILARLYSPELLAVQQEFLAGAYAGKGPAPVDAEDLVDQLVGQSPDASLGGHQRLFRSGRTRSRFPGSFKAIAGGLGSMPDLLALGSWSPR